MNPRWPVLETPLDLKSVIDLFTTAYCQTYSNFSNPKSPCRAHSEWRNRRRNGITRLPKKNDRAALLNLPTY